MTHKISAVSFLALAFVLAFASWTSAQCATGNCGVSECSDCTAATSFMSNVAGSVYESENPPCGSELCQKPCIPAACCGNYISVFGGWSSVDNFDFETTLAGNITEISGLNLDNDYGAGIAIGQQFHARGRIEFEGAYRENDFEFFGESQFTNGLLTSNVLEAATGSLETTTIMANYLYDFTPRCLNRFHLYGGGGIGGLHIEGNAVTATRNLVIDDETFVYQIIAGVNRTVTQRVDLFTEYRYTGSTSINVFDTVAGATEGSFDFSTNNLFFGLRYRW